MNIHELLLSYLATLQPGQTFALIDVLRTEPGRKIPQLAKVLDNYAAKRWLICKTAGRFAKL
jgi:hypothetical protein